MGKRSQVSRQRWIVKLLSDGKIWTNREIYEASLEHYKGGLKGFASFHSMASLLGQMSRHTNRRISETHEIVNVGSGICHRDGTSERFMEYMLQER